MFTTKNLLILIGRNALVSLVAVSIAMIGIFFLSKEIGSVSDFIALNHRLEAEWANRTALSEILKHDSQIVGTNNTLIEAAFPPTDNILDFISILDSLATKNSLTQVYSFTAPVPSSLSAPFPISTIPYINSLEANVLVFSNYLKDFDKLPYFTKIDGFNISSQGKTGWLEVSTITYQATLYSKTAQ